MARVLIVDDAGFMRMMLKDILQKANHQVVAEAPTGEDAVDIYKKLHKENQQPDIVLLDITMPGISGIDVLREILKINKQAVVIMCSAMNGKMQVIEALEQGAKHFIAKPFQEQKVIETIEKFLP